MTNTPHLGLPLLQAAQAQKHVTVNEALVLLDGAANLTLISADIAAPPALASDGDCYAVPAGATGDWSGQDAKIAIWSNGGWVFVPSRRGWRSWIVDRQMSAVFDGTVWVYGAAVLSQNNAATVHEVLEINHPISAGTTNAIVGAIPAQSMVIGVTGRVTTVVTGTLSDWRLGVSGSDDRYGNGLGLPLGSWLRGLTSAPQTYFSDTDLLLTGNGGDFAAGTIRVAVHLMRLNIPAV